MALRLGTCLAIACLLIATIVLSHFLPTHEEMHFNETCSLAFGILVSQSDWEAFPRFFAKVFSAHSIYCINIDGKVNSSVRDFLRKSIFQVTGGRLSRVTLSERNVTYRGISHTLTLLDLMECASQSGVNYKF